MSSGTVNDELVNCESDLRLQLLNTRMSLTPYFIIARRVSPRPKAKPEYFSGSMPPALRTFGCIMPQGQSSSQPESLQEEQPSPPQIRHWIRQKRLERIVSESVKNATYKI